MENSKELENAETTTDTVNIISKIGAEQSSMEFAKESYDDQENKSLYESKNCEIYNVSDHQEKPKDFETNKLYQSTNRESIYCNYCGEYFELLIYRRHHLKCWRAFCQKASLNRNNTEENNKSFPKKEFSANSNRSVNSRRSCNVCGLKFRSRLQYAMHVRRKRFCRPPPFICTKCGRVFKHLHLLISHEKRKIPCTVLEAKSSESTSQKNLSSAELDDQNSINKTDDQVKCEKCGTQFASLHWYERHILQTNCCRFKENKLQNISQRKYKTPYLEKFRTVRGYKCKRCGHLFRYPYRLRDHLMRKVPCVPRSARKTMPPVKSLTNDNQRDESNMSDNMIEEKCPNIENTNANVGRKIIRKYWKIANTQSKQKKRQVDVMNKYGTLICCICNKKFFNSYTWNNHLRVHSTAGEKCFVKCPVCQTVFRSAYMLYCHQKKTNHWGKLMKSRINYCQCPFCGKKFSYVGSRKNHVQLHMQDYPSAVKEFLENTTCSICNIHFVTEAKKMAHVRKAHLPDSNSENIENITKVGKQKIKQEFSPQSSQVKNFNNSNVNVSGSGKKNILSEDKISEPHSCSYCYKKFSRLNFLIRHQQETHNEYLAFQCSACEQKFATKSMISQHIRRKHRNIPKSNLILKIDKAPYSELEQKLEEENKDLQQSSQFQTQNADDSKRGIYSCELCNLDHFRKVSALRRHKKSKLHKDNLRQSKLRENAKLSYIHNNKTPVICSVCNQSFDSLNCFIPHRLDHFNFQSADSPETMTNNPYYCEICSKVILRRKRVQTHLLSHLRKISIIESNKARDDCNLKQSLPEGFSEKQNSKIEIEENNATNAKPELYPDGRKKKVNFTCKVCKKSFRTKRLHTFHVRYRCRFQLTCELCKKQFPSKKKYLYHKERFRCKVVAPKLHCQYCSLDFSSVSDLKWHEKSCQKVHGTESGDFNLDDMNNLFHCQYCHSPFLTLQTCQEHENYCKNEVFCSLCRSYFTSHELLNKHKSEFHTSNQLLNCLTCGKFFSSPKLLNVHMESHNEEIKECGSQTNIASAKLKSDETLSCPHCNLNYQDQHDFKEHLVIHNPFKCPVCGKIENSIHGFRKHPCRLPNGTFATGIVFQKKQTKMNYIKKDDEVTSNVECETKNFSELRNNTIVLSEETTKMDKNKNHEDGIERAFSNNDDFGEKLPLDILRDNFSQLLYLFVADPELMSQFGWGQRLIDDVLDDVLQNMGQNSIGRDPTISELERLRENIRVLLRICIKDQVMDAVDSDNKSIDEIVIDMLGMCQASLEGQTNSSDNIPVS